MRRNWYWLVALLLALCLGLAFYFNRKSGQVENSSAADEHTVVGLRIGNQAPDFTLQTLTGKSIRLSDYRGKKVILNFWATWCPPCKAEVPDFVKFYAEARTDNVEIVAVNITADEKSKADVAEFVKAYSITYPVLLDEQGVVAKRYAISAIPTTYLLDTKGRVVQKHTGLLEYKTLQKLAAQAE